MAFSNQTEQSAMSEINVTPLVDVMLVLLVIFIVTAPLLMQAVKVNLPKTAPVSQIKQTQPVQISIDAQGTIFIDQRAIHADTLEAELARLHTANSGISVQLHADEAVRYGRVALVMAATQRAGISKLSFVTTAR